MGSFPTIFLAMVNVVFLGVMIYGLIQFIKPGDKKRIEKGKIKVMVGGSGFIVSAWSYHIVAAYLI